MWIDDESVGIGVNDKSEVVGIWVGCVCTDIVGVWRCAFEHNVSDPARGMVGGHFFGGTMAKPQVAEDRWAMGITAATKLLKLEEGVMAEVSRTRTKWVYADDDGMYVIATGPEEADQETVDEPPSKSWPRKPDADVLCVYCIRQLWEVGRRVRVCNCGHVVHADCLYHYPKRTQKCRVCNLPLTMMGLDAYFKKQPSDQPQRMTPKQAPKQQLLKRKR